MELIDVVNKLVGKINPIGETNEDDRRFENLKSMCVLVDKLIYKIDEVAKENEHANEFSVKRASEYAKKFISDLGIEG